MAEALRDARVRPTLRRIAWGVMALVLTSPLWFNLLLATPLATAPVERLIRQHSGLDCELGRLSAWPGRGLGVHQLRILTPRHFDDFAGLCLLEVESIRIRPRWGALVRGKLELDSLTLREPRLMLPVEVLMAAIPPSPPPTVGPALAVHHSSPPQGSAGPTAALPVRPTPGSSGNAGEADAGQTASSSEQSNPSATEDTATPPTRGKNPPPTRGKTPPPTRVKNPPPTQGKNPPPTQWCHIENASLRLYSHHHPGFDLTLRDFGGSLPIGGKRAKSKITLGRLSHLRLELLKRSRLQVEWDGDELRLEAPAMSLGGLDTRWKARLQPRAGLPFQIVTHSPTQGLDGQWQGPAGLRARAARLGYRAEMGGLLASPATWRGYALAAVQQAELTVAPHRAEFDHGTLQVNLLPGGWIHCAQAVLRDDEATLMATGDLWSDGRFAASLRLVTDPRQAAGIAQTLFPDLDLASRMTPLSTPQRCAFDLEASGRPGQIELRVGHEGPVLHLPADTRTPPP